MTGPLNLDSKRNHISILVLFGIQLFSILGSLISVRTINENWVDTLINRWGEWSLVAIPLMVSLILSFIACLLLPIELTFLRALTVTLFGAIIFAVCFYIIPFFTPPIDMFFLVTIIGFFIPVTLVYFFVTSILLWAGSKLRNRYIRRSKMN